MASEVAPCMALQIFLRSGTGNGRRQRPPAEVCRRLAENMDQLVDLVAEVSGGSGDGPTTTGTSSGSGASPELISTASDAGQASAAEPPPAGGGAPRHGREGLQRSISEDVQKNMRLVSESLEDAADRIERGDQVDGTAGDFLTHFIAADLPVRLVASLGDLAFEVRKVVTSVFSVIVRLGSGLGADHQIQDYARRTPRFFHLLVEGYSREKTATHCGMMLRSCARHRQLVAAFLEQPLVFNRLLTFTSHGSFDVSSDAFSSLHDLLLTHKDVSATFLEGNFQEFFRLYNALLQTDDYVTQRQALKLLSEILLDRTFMRVMLMYIGEEQFLQIHMNLLRSDSKVIQFEAFHVFKIFVANPQKPPKVQLILYRNKEKLVRLLETLGANRQDDTQFAEDRSTVIGKLQALEAPPSTKKDSTPTCASAAAVGSFSLASEGEPPKGVPEA